MYSDMSSRFQYFLLINNSALASFKQYKIPGNKHSCIKTTKAFTMKSEKLDTLIKLSGS